MSKVEVNEIDKQSGSTLTIGGSGTTVQLGTGASQTGFGATGGISWQTAIKTTDFTAVSGEGYFVNTSGGSDITVTLPASPSAGNVVAIKDYARTFGTNKVIMARNGSNMDGTAGNTNLDTDGLSVTFVFMDSTKGWSFINEDTTSQAAAQFVAATGGTVATCGNFKIHTFTGPGTFCVSCAGNAGGSNTVSYMVIAGGGGGGGVVASNVGGGGGGAGGYREGLGLNDSYTGSPLRAPTGIPVTATGFPIVVGAGGAGGPSPAGTPGANGSVSSFSTISSAGGGFGGGGNSPPPTPNLYGGNPGGSGGGASFSPGVKGNGNDPSVSPPQGNNGGCATCSPYRGAGAGGGATAVGGESAGTGPPSPSPTAFLGALGGAGATTSINGTPTARASGGSGGAFMSSGATPSATPGGGGAGGPGNGGNGTAGTTNTGGGGGGGGSGNPGPGGTGGTGGSGIVIIRYKFQ